MCDEKVYKYFQYIPAFRFEVPKQEKENTVAGLVFTLDCVAYLFANVNPAIGTKPLTVTIVKNQDSPICIRESNLILLDCGIFSWAQAAYQFAHELCHYSMPKSVHPKLRWLEESICQTASLFFLCRTDDLWRAMSVPYITDTGSIYAHSFSEYARNDAAKAIPFDFTCPSQISDLEVNCYQREKNRHIANQLLPIFTAYPTLWSAVPSLCQIQEVHTLSSAFDEWLRQVHQGLRSGVLQIRTLFAV